MLVFDVPELPEFTAVVPGGGIEEGESIAETAIREVKEETGIDAEFVRELGVAENPTGHYVHLKAIGLLPGSWPHGHVVCRWAPIQAGLEVWGRRGDFIHALVRKRVVGYVTRERDGLHELLVFDHESMPDVPTQVPAGRIDAHESLEEGVLREVEEETGLTGIRIAAELADADQFERLFGPGAHRSWAFHALADAAGPDRWEHLVSGTGMDSGLVFLCRWVPLDDCPPLWGEPDPLVERLRRSISHP